MPGKPPSPPNQSPKKKIKQSSPRLAFFRANSLNLNNNPPPTNSPNVSRRDDTFLPVTPPNKQVNLMPLPTPIKQFVRRSPRLQMHPCLRVLLGSFGKQADTAFAPSPWGKVVCLMSNVLDFKSKLALNQLNHEARRLMGPNSGLDAAYFWVHFNKNNANAQLKVDRFGAFRNIVPSAPNPYCFSSLGARFTFRRIALAMLQPGCKHCGKSEEKLFFNAFICSMTCRECWHEGGELCTITYAQAKLPIKAFMFTDDPTDCQKIYKYKTEDANLICALGHSNATLTICSYPMALEFAIDQFCEDEVTKKLQRAAMAMNKSEMIQTHSRGIGSTHVNLVQRNQKFHSKGQLWYYMNHLGMYYLPRPGTVLKRNIRVLVADMSVEQAKQLPGCQGVEVVVSNLYKGLIQAIPPAHTHRDHLFTAAIVGVAKHCCMISMWDQLSAKDRRDLGVRDIVDHSNGPLFRFDQSQTKAIHSCNTRIFGILDDSGTRPIIESDSVVFINDFELTVQNIEFRKQIDVVNGPAKYDAVMQNAHNYKTYTTVENCEFIELPFEYHGDWESDEEYEFEE
ncbi:hypothetical protein TrST_g3865 [Triparma strigata]|uniref:Uncharacterized protein n=1 Tax=Triparma strigata TaxID=1606541 RepID=A0A9W6ZKZ3_9STRA|nr:hypothetical protein TrST_g3865 [Triparma strigata]